MRIIEKNLDKIVALCKKHKVSKLFVFGSILTNEFKKSSDIDLMVDFADVDLSNYADNYFELKYSLEELFDRPIDLLEEKAINNPYFKKTVDSTKLLIYG